MLKHSTARTPSGLVDACPSASYCLPCMCSVSNLEFGPVLGAGNTISSRRVPLVQSLAAEILRVPQMAVNAGKNVPE